LHPAQTPAGPEPGAPGLVTIAAQAPVEGGSLFVSQAEPPASHALALAVVEEVFAGLAETAQVVQGSALVQPGVILNSESNDQAQTNMVRDLALVQASAGVSQAAEWLPGDWLALLGQTARPGLLASPTDPMDGAAEDADLAGLEAFFTRLAGEGDSSRTP